MSDSLPQNGCGCPPVCTSPIVQNIPGPPGSNGFNAFTTTAIDFTIPAVHANVNVFVVNALWPAVGQNVYIAGAGYFQVIALFANAMTLFNINSNNTAPGTVIAAGAQVSPAGATGVGGTMNSISPTTTKGDLIVDNGANSPLASDIRFPAGTNKNVLHADSTQTLGLRYSAVDLSGAGTNLINALAIGSGGTGQTTQQAAINTLLNSGVSVLGDLAHFDGANWIRFPITVTTGKKQMLAINDAGTDVAYKWQGVLQYLFQLFTTYTAVGGGASLTADSLPGSSAGTQIFTQAITPTNTTSRIRVKARVLVFTSASGGFLSLLNNTTVIAVTASDRASGLQVLTLDYTFAPGATTAITLNLRAGTGSSGTLYVNGNASNHVFSTGCQSIFEVEEIA